MNRRKNTWKQEILSITEYFALLSISLQMLHIQVMKLGKMYLVDMCGIVVAVSNKISAVEWKLMASGVGPGQPTLALDL